MGYVEIGLAAMAITAGLVIALLFTLNWIAGAGELKSPPREATPVFSRHAFTRLDADIDPRLG